MTKDNNIYMKHTILLLIIIIISCSYDVSVTYNIEIDNKIYTWQYITDEKKHGKFDYWQTPEESLKDMSGDCEDFHILVAYLLYRDTGKKSEFIYCYDVEENVFHILLKYENKYINFTEITSELDDKYVYIYIYSYNELMTHVYNQL